jgi:hypothetical protein
MGVGERTVSRARPGCEKLQDDGDGINFPPGGQLVMSCRFDATFPESVKRSDFKVGVHYDECCETDAKHRVWLPFQNLPVPQPVKERETSSTEPGTRRSSPPVRYLPVTRGRDAAACAHR